MKIRNAFKVEEMIIHLKNWREETNAPIPMELNPEYDEVIDFKVDS